MGGKENSLFSQFFWIFIFQNLKFFTHLFWRSKTQGTFKSLISEVINPLEYQSLSVFVSSLHKVREPKVELWSHSFTSNLLFIFHLLSTQEKPQSLICHVLSLLISYESPRFLYGLITLLNSSNCNHSLGRNSNMFSLARFEILSCTHEIFNVIFLSF